MLAENRLLRKKLGKKRISLTDDERRVLAVKGKLLGRQILQEVANVVTPDTILRWHRELNAAKWNHSEQRKARGRPKIAAEVEELALRMARENPAWGFDHIQGALANLGHGLSDATVGNILRAQGIEPAPERKRQTTWKTFIQAHWDVLASVDFTMTGKKRLLMDRDAKFSATFRAVPPDAGVQRVLNLPLGWFF